MPRALALAQVEVASEPCLSALRSSWGQLARELPRAPGADSVELRELGLAALLGEHVRGLATLGLANCLPVPASPHAGPMADAHPGYVD